MPSGFLSITGTDAFQALGPFSAGDVLGAVDFTIYPVGAGTVQTSFVLSRTGDEDQATFEAGSALLGASNIRLFGKPAFTLASEPDVVYAGLVRVDQEVQSGPVWVLVAFSVLVIAAHLNWSVGMGPSRIRAAGAAPSGGAAA